MVGEVGEYTWRGAQIHTLPCTCGRALKNLGAATICGWPKHFKSVKRLSKVIIVPRQSAYCL